MDPAARLTVTDLTGAPFASSSRAQKSVAPPALMIAARTTCGPGFSVMRFDTPSSMTLCRSLYSAITSWPSSHQTDAAFDPMASLTSARSRGVLTTVTTQKRTFDVGLFSASAKGNRLTF